MNTIRVINFNEPQNAEELQMMLENENYPALFRFEPDQEMIRMYGNHYVRNLENFWVLEPEKEEYLDPEYVLLEGENDIFPVVSTERPEHGLNSDITLICQDYSRINLKDFQTYKFMEYQESLNQHINPK